MWDKRAATEVKFSTGRHLVEDSEIIDAEVVEGGEVIVLPFGIGADLENIEDGGIWSDLADDEEPIDSEIVDDTEDEIDDIDDLPQPRRRLGRLAIREPVSQPYRRRRKSEAEVPSKPLFGFPDPLPVAERPEGTHIELWGIEGYLSSSAVKGEDEVEPAKKNEYRSVELSAKTLTDLYLRSIDGPSDDDILAVDIEELEVAVSWRRFSNCLGVDPDLFFPERGASTKEAKGVCHGCVVKKECLEYALTTGEKFGIWGGLSERERRRIRRQRALARAAQQPRVI
jgi:WhiB family redox-sensing transcriptional regulator